MRDRLPLWLLLGASALAAPSYADSAAAAAPTHTLEIRGSGAMGALARALVEQYMADHPEAIVTVQTCGAFQALKSLIIGTCDLAMATDEVPDELEQLARERGVTLKRTDVYRDALAVVVHPDNPVHGLTLRQLRDIFRGAITHWSEVGGRDAPIEVLSANPASAVYEVFKRRVLGDTAVVTPKAALLNTRQIKDRLHEGAIAYVSLSQLVKNDLTGVAIDGVQASTETVASGRYPIVRHMSLYQRAPGSELGDKVIQYFLAVDRGGKLIQQAGSVPMTLK